MILYLDSSAFLKLYVNEPGAAEVRHAVGAAQSVYTHVIAYAEMRAALARAVRMGRASSANLARHKAELERDWALISVIQADEALVRDAGDLAERFGLRGYDSVHLAAAAAVFRAAGPAVEFRFAAFDNGLRKAAGGLGMRLLA